MRRLATAAVFAAALAAGVADAQSVSTDYVAAPAGTYRLDPAQTSVTLKVSHLGLSAYTLRLQGVKGQFTFDPNHPEASRLQVQMDAGSVSTGDPAFDRQVATEVLDAPRYPELGFVSTAVKPGQGGRGQVVGDLTLHGQTHPVTLDVIFNGFLTDPASHAVRMGFSADAAVRRSDYGVTKLLPLVGDQVGVVIEAEFTR